MDFVMMRTTPSPAAAYAARPPWHINAFGLNPIVLFGTEEQRRRMLPPVVRGREKACLAVTAQDADGSQERSLHRPESVDLNRPGRA